MMHWEGSQQQLLYALATWPACGAVFWTALCRLNSMGRNVMWRVAAEYATYAAIAVGVFFAPTVDEWPGPIMLGVIYGVAVIILCQWKAWEGDKPPPEATGEPSP